jgi:hypothetical protein
MIKRIVGLIGLPALAAIAMSAATTPPASAEECFKVDTPKSGNYTDDGCNIPTNKPLEGEYVYGFKIKKIEGNLWCVDPLPNINGGETGEYSDNECKEKKVDSFRTKALVEPTKLLPEPTLAKPVLFKSKSGIGKLVSAALTIECKSDTDEGLFISANLGDIHIDFKECTALGGRCNSEGDSEGVILVLGEIHYILMLKTEKLISGFVILPIELHITCKIITNQLISIRGCVAGEQTTEEKLVERFTVIYNAVGPAQEILKILMEFALKEVECKLEASMNGGAFEAMGETTADENEGFVQGEKAIAVLLMNK